MDKNLEYYMTLNYPVRTCADPEGGFFIEIPDLPGCMSQGDTIEEAYAMIEDAKRAWLEVEIEDGRPIPEPQEINAYSGKILVRMSKSLHKKLADQAKTENVSLNHHVVSILSEGAGSKVKASELKSLEMKIGQIIQVIEQIAKNDIARFSYQQRGILQRISAVQFQENVYRMADQQGVGGRINDELCFASTVSPYFIQKNTNLLKEKGLVRTIGDKIEDEVAA
jgi:antitoxin HicB